MVPNLLHWICRTYLGAGDILKNDITTTLYLQIQNEYYIASIQKKKPLHFGIWGIGYNHDLQLGFPDPADVIGIQDS
jgi:hypothetical protein